jgi:hypothetical protein
MLLVVLMLHKVSDATPSDSSVERIEKCNVTDYPLPKFLNFTRFPFQSFPCPSHNASFCVAGAIQVSIGIDHVFKLAENIATALGYFLDLGLLLDIELLAGHFDFDILYNK